LSPIRSVIACIRFPQIIIMHNITNFTPSAASGLDYLGILLLGSQKHIDHPAWLMHDLRNLAPHMQGQRSTCSPAGFNVTLFAMQNMGYLHPRRTTTHYLSVQHDFAGADNCLIIVLEACLLCRIQAHAMPRPYTSPDSARRHLALE